MKISFLISNTKHMLWVLKRTDETDSSFEHPEHMLKLMDKKIFTIYAPNLVYLDLW